MPHGSALKARIQIMRHDLNSIGGLFIIILIGKGPKMGVCYRGMLLKPLIGARQLEATSTTKEPMTTVI